MKKSKLAGECSCHLALNLARHGRFEDAINELQNAGDSQRAYIARAQIYKSWAETMDGEGTVAKRKELEHEARQAVMKARNLSWSEETPLGKFDSIYLNENSEIYIDRLDLTQEIRSLEQQMDSTLLLTDDMETAQNFSAQNLQFCDDEGSNSILGSQTPKHSTPTAIQTQRNGGGLVVQRRLNDRNVSI